MALSPTAMKTDDAPCRLRGGGVDALDRPDRLAAEAAGAYDEQISHQKRSFHERGKSPGCEIIPKTPRCDARRISRILFIPT